MDITVNDSTLTYLATGISIKKITISSISIDPLKRIANFTVSYWNGTVLLGQETKTYNATYTMLMTTQPTLKSISMPVITTYNTTITLNSTQYTIDTTVFPYFTSGLTIYYNPTDPSMISLSPTQNYIQFDNAMYTSDNRSTGIDIFYTITSIQYNITGLPSSSKPTAGITTIYYNWGRTKISLTMDSTFYDKYQLSQTDTISVRSVQNLLKQTQTYSYVNIPTPIYKSSSTLPSLTIYYNPATISDISLTNAGVYTQQKTATFFSVVQDTQDTSKYIFSNINYTVANKNITLSNKTLTGALDSTNLPPLYCNPLNQSDISLTQSTPDDYNKLLTFLNDPLNIVSISPLIKILNTSFSTKNVTNNINNTIIIQ
jgi:hypothetical protein